MAAYVKGSLSGLFSKWPALALLFGVVALGGCAQQPVMPQVDQSLPEQWSSPLGSEQGWPDQHWWQGFQSDELTQLVQEALSHNFDLAAAAARVLQAEAQVRVSGATLLPGIDLDLRSSRQGEVGEGGSSSYGAGLSASYEIDFWGKNWSALSASEASLEASRFDQDTVRLTTTAAVANTYLQVLSLRDRLRIAQLNLENAQRVLELTELRVNTGAASPLELAQQRSVVAQQRAGIPAIRQQEREAMAALAALLGKPPQLLEIEGDTLVGLQAPPVVAGLPSELLQRRPDIRRAEAQLYAAAANVAAARASLFPSVRLTASLGLQGQEVSSLFDGNPAYSLGASLLQPIFDAGRLKAQKELAEARQLELIQTYRSAIVDAFADVDTALTAIEHLRQQRQLQDEVLEQARLTLSLAEIRYREGAEDLLTVLDAQRTYYSAQDQRLQLELAALQALVDLYRALGGGWPVAEVG